MVMSVNGTQEGMGCLAQALVDEGDTVLVPDPCYPVFRALVVIAGADVAFYPLSAEHDFLHCASDISDEVADKAH